MQDVSCPVVRRHFEEAWRRFRRGRAAERRVRRKRCGIVIGMPSFVRMRHHDSGSERFNDAANDRHGVEEPVCDFLIAEAEGIQLRGTVRQLLEGSVQFPASCVCVGTGVSKAGRCRVVHVLWRAVGEMRNRNRCVALPLQQTHQAAGA